MSATLMTLTAFLSCPRLDEADLYLKLKKSPTAKKPVFYLQMNLYPSIYFRIIF